MKLLRQHEFPTYGQTGVLNKRYYSHARQSVLLRETDTEVGNIPLQLRLTPTYWLRLSLVFCGGCEVMCTANSHLHILYINWIDNHSRVVECTVGSCKINRLRCTDN